MSDAAASAPSPAKKASKKKASSKKAAGASHPTYQKMVADAIRSLKERGGSSRIKIQRWIIANYKPDLVHFAAAFRQALKRAVEKGDLIQDKQSFRLAAKAKKEKKPKKKAVKKVGAAKSTTKKTSKKKSSGKKKSGTKKSKKSGSKKSSGKKAKKSSKKKAPKDA